MLVTLLTVAQAAPATTAMIYLQQTRVIQISLIYFSSKDNYHQGILFELLTRFALNIFELRAHSGAHLFPKF